MGRENKRKTGFLFDLDGVLIDSEKEYSRIWNIINEMFPTGIENLAEVIKGQTLDKILGDHYPDKETRKQVQDELHRREKEMRYEYCEGARTLLDNIAEREITSAIVTSSDDKKMAHLYEEIPELKMKVTSVIDASKVKKSKPDPEGYLLAAAEIGVEIRNCVVFEDSVQGVKAGKNSGAFVVGITGTKSREELTLYSDVVVDSLSEINLDELIEILERR